MLTSAKEAGFYARYISNAVIIHAYAREDVNISPVQKTTLVFLYATVADESQLEAAGSSTISGTCSSMGVSAASNAKLAAFDLPVVVDVTLQHCVVRGILH